jgi:ABC-type multidrug transport system ATPase subunit
MGLLRPTSGEARFFGLDTWRQSPAVKARIGFVPGDLHLYERMTGEGLVRFLAGYRARGRWIAGGRSRGTSTSTSSCACATSPRATGRSWSSSRR